MPRNVRRPLVRARKRPTKWCAIVNSAATPNTANLAVGDGIPLCDVTTAANDQADPVVGWCRGSISLSRGSTADVAPRVAWAIVSMRLDAGTGNPVQEFDPWVQSDLERQDILGMGHLEVPAIVKLPTVADTDSENHATTVAHINIRVGRKLPRNTNNLFLWIVTQGIDNGYTATVTVRTLMKFN